MNFINKLNRKFGRYAIHNLMFYIIILYGAGFLINTVNPYFYSQYLMLDIERILHGEIWRIVTFIIQPPGSSNIIFLAFALYLYYMIGTNLERAWGAFRFNLYYLSGILFNILAVVIIYLVTGGISYPIGLTYINQSLFFAFAALYPNVQFLIFFILPIKVKYLAYIYAAYLVYVIFGLFRTGNFYEGIAIIVAMGNFLIYFFATRNYNRISPSEFRRKAVYKKQVRTASSGSNVVEFQGRKKITRHKCAVCGRTELDNENLEFRFCSKCDGNYEYCMDHLFTHEHVKNSNSNPNNQ